MIVQDEQRRIPEALASLDFCDEVVVVDGGSGDDTVALARAGGAMVIENPWPGFARQRNVALAAASGDWVLELDADERVSPQLRASIEALLASPPNGAEVAVCPLRHRFLGGLLGPSAKYPAYRTRLFRRGAYEHDESRRVHEGIEPRERPIVLEGDIEHELADSPREALADAWRYARLESEHLAPPGSPLTYVVGIVLRPAAKFAYRLLLEGGWRDGWRGLAKIALDAGSDALVWALVLLGPGRNGGGDGTAPTPQPPSPPRRASTPQPAPGASASGHFGRRPNGPPKVVAIASRGAPESAAARWLGALADGGVDVALVGEREGPSASALPGQRVERLVSLQTARALDVEMQIRTIDAVVAFGARARLALRLLPAALHPSIAGVAADADPSQALTRLPLRSS
jgi:hypothetical protein